MVNNASALFTQEGPKGPLSRGKFFSTFGPHETRIQTKNPTMLYPEV
jgi:hypothetical protein